MCGKQEIKVDEESQGQPATRRRKLEIKHVAISLLEIEIEEERKPGLWLYGSVI